MSSYVLNMLGNCYVFLPLHLFSNCSEADQIGVSHSPSLIYDTGLLPVFRNLSWSTGPLTDHQEWICSDTDQVLQRSHTHPTSFFVLDSQNHPLTSVRRVRLSPDPYHGDMGFLKVSLKTKGKKTSGTLGFFMFWATRSCPHLAAGPGFP